MERQFIIESKSARQEAVTYVAHLKHEPKMVVEVKQYKKLRSNQANRYYWGTVLKTISDYTGHDPEHLHEFFKRKFLYQENMKILGQDIEVYPSTTKLNTKDFGEYIDKVCIFAVQELSCYMPHSGDF